MSDHTPGPWGVEWQRPCYWLIRDESGFGVHLPPGDSIDDPNRLLIERAPQTKRQRDELLAVMREVDRFFRQNDDFTDGGEFPVPEFIVAAREAINNATKEEE